MVCLDKNSDNFEFSNEYFEYLLKNNKEFDDEDIAEFIDGWEIERQYGDTHRWDREVNSICELLGKYYCVQWRVALTEYQDNDYTDSQPFEVYKYQYSKMCNFHDWKIKGDCEYVVFTELEGIVE